MKGAAYQKKSSRKVQGLFDGSLVLRVLSPIDRKKHCQKKVKEFNVRTQQQAKPTTSPSKLDIVNDQDQVPLVPTVELTEEQVANFIETICVLKERFAKYGALKLRLPKGVHVQPLNLSLTKKKLTVRQQVLPMLPQGKVI